MIALILTIALIGILVYLIITFVPMPPQFKTIILVVALIIVVLYVLAAFGLLGSDIAVPRVRRVGP